MAAPKQIIGLFAFTVLIAACAYEQRNGGLFEPSMAMARERIERARQSGDAMRKADVQINLDLDLCEQVMHTWLMVLANEGPGDFGDSPKSDRKRENATKRASAMRSTDYERI